MKHDQHYRSLQRLEQTVRDKLDKGWNAFSRDEVAAILELLQGSRKARANLQQRLHTAHGEAVAWHFEGDVGLHARRPAPVGARNLFEKPVRLDFVSGWRVPKGCRITGFIRTPDGMLVPARNRDPLSPNDLMRRLHASLTDLSFAYKVYENGSDSNSNQSGTLTVAGGSDNGAGSGDNLDGVGLPQQSDADRQDSPSDGEAS